MLTFFVFGCIIDKKERGERVTVIEYPRFKPDVKKNGRAVALGFFDGVHIAHRTLIEKAVRQARKTGAVASVFTFMAESANIKAKSPRIYTTEQKLKIFASLGVDEVILADFDKISNITKEEFAKDFLIDTLDCTAALFGYNFRFGKGREGDATYLDEFMTSRERLAIVQDEVTLEGKKISATVIREALKKGNCEEAASLLGAPYFLSGRVEKGLGKGRALGFPTVNITLPSATLLKQGVYRSAIEVDGRAYSAVTNVGTCPTVCEREAHAESYIIGYNGDLYGKELDVSLLGYLREERLFPTYEALTEQIKKDALTAEILNQEYIGKKK